MYMIAILVILIYITVAKYNQKGDKIMKVNKMTFLFSVSILLGACGTGETEADEIVDLSQEESSTEDVEQSASEDTEIEKNETDDVPEDFEGEYDLNFTFISTPSADQYFDEESYLDLADLNQQHYRSPNSRYVFTLPSEELGEGYLDYFYINTGEYFERNDSPEVITYFEGLGFDIEFIDELMQEDTMPLRSEFIEMRYSDSLNTLEELGKDLEKVVSPSYRGNESYNIGFQSQPTIWHPGFAPSNITENVPDREFSINTEGYHPRTALQRGDSLGEHVIEVIDLSSDERFTEEEGFIYPENSDDEEDAFAGMILYENSDYQVVLFMTEADLAVGATTLINENIVLTPSEQEERETLAESIREDLLNLLQGEEIQSIFAEHLGE